MILGDLLLPESYLTVQISDNEILFALFLFLYSHPLTALILAEMPVPITCFVNKMDVCKFFIVYGCGVTVVHGM
jgi:hypothetical protein